MAGKNEKKHGVPFRSQWHSATLTMLAVRRYQAPSLHIIPATNLLLATFFTALLTACSETASTTATSPTPPAAAPNAIWAGGADGGAWIDCAMGNNAPTITYTCTTYHESGNVWSRGTYVLALPSASGNGFTPASSPHPLHFQYYDGRMIGLTEQHMLVPNGIVHYPMAGGDEKSGTRISYNLGEREQ